MKPKIIISLNETEAMLTREALLDAAIALRTKSNGIVIDEKAFLADPNYSNHRKERYHILMDVAAEKIGLI